MVVSGVCVMYILYAEFAIMAYGSQKNYSLVLDALPATSPVTYTLKALYTVNLFFSYPMQMSPALNLVEGFIFDKNSAPTVKRYWLQNLVRAGCVIFTIVLALLVYPYISVFLEIVSASTCSPLAFTLPALFHYKLKGGNKAHLMIAILTTILTVYMVITSIIEFVHEIGGKEE